MGEMMEIDFNEQNAVKDLSYFILRARDDHVVVSLFLMPLLNCVKL